MKLNNKGFTLLELSAIMIVLAVLLLIAYGGIKKIIISTEKGAFKVAAESIAKAADNNFAIDNEADEYYFIDGDQYSSGRDLKFKGETPKSGIVSVSSTGNTALAIHNGKYCATISGDGEEALVVEKTVAECVTYNIIDTEKTWQEIANDNNTSIVDLLDLNSETDQNSETTNKDIKIPVKIIPDLETLALLEQTEAYQTYYTIAKTVYNASLNEVTYSYTINLGMLPMPLAEIKSAEVISSSVMKGIEDFKQYIVRKLMGAVVWPAGEEVTLSIDQAQGFKDHSVTSANMDVDNVVVTCNETKCSATVTETIHNLTEVIPNGTEVYLPVKFTVKFSDSALVATSCNTYKTYNSNVSSLISQGYIPIASASDLNQIRQDGISLTFGAGTPYVGTYVSGLDKKYIQVSDIDLSIYSAGVGFVPLGSDGLPETGGAELIFTGIYDGGCYKISNLTINRPSDTSIGLFGITEGSVELKNIFLENSNVIGYSEVGGIVGSAWGTTAIVNSFVQGTISGNDNIGGVLGNGWSMKLDKLSSNVTINVADYQGGGIAGYIDESFVRNSYSNSIIVGTYDDTYTIGGFAGNIDSAIVSNSYAISTLTGAGEIGGFAGQIDSSSAWGDTIIMNSYADARIDSNDYEIGGFVGWSNRGFGDAVTLIRDCYSTGEIISAFNEATGTINLGGLVGYNEGTIENSYSTVNSTVFKGYAAGLVGYNYQGSVKNSYSTGTVTGASTNTGGLIGFNNAGTVTNSYYYRGTNNSIGTLVSEAELKNSTTFTGWDIASVWEINDNFPTLKMIDALFMSNDLVFDKVNNSIIGYIGLSKDVIIPSSYTINGSTYTVTNIAEDGLDNNNIESISFPSTLTTIGASGLAGNIIKNLALPNTITAIGNSAFQNNKITTLTIPSSMSVIPQSAFYDNFLTSLTIPGTVTTIDGAAFAYNKLETLVIEPGVTTIGQNAFQCNNLTSISIPSTVVTIDRVAFNENKLPVDQAFIYARNGDGSIDYTKIIGYGGAERDNVVIPNGVTTIGSDAFNLDGGSYQTYYPFIYIKAVTFPSTLVTIEAAAFRYQQLTSISIPSSVTTIGNEAFYANLLTSVAIPNSVTSLGTYAFNYNKITSATLPSGLITIPQGLFNSNLLTSIVIPSSVTSIGANAFSNNILTSVAIPNSVTSIGGSAFRYNNMLQNSFTIDRATGTVSMGSYILNNNGATKTTTITPRYLR